MIIRIASTRTPKVNGVKKAFEKVLQHFHITNLHYQFETVATESGVPDTPRSLSELLTGAKNRAEKVFMHGVTDFSVGVEGGVFHVGDKVFLQSWTCVFNGNEFHFGASGSIELPPVLADVVFFEREDLGMAIDTFAEQVDVRSNQGTFGILTNDLITREDSFELSAVSAFIPFFHSAIYGSAPLK